MKKKLLILIPIILITIIGIYIIAGTTKEKKEYSIIELTGPELINTIITKDKTSITFALYNEYDVQSEQFLEDLKKTSRQAQENIYYINTSHTTFEFSEIINAITSTTTDTLSYFVYQDGKLVISNTYKNFKTLYKDLNGKKYDTKVIKTPVKEKNDAIKKAEELYDKGDIAAAYNYLSIAWDTKEAKEHYQERPYYKLIGSWEIFEPDDKMVNTKYINFLFLNYQSILLTAEHEDKIDGFKKPSTDKYEEYYIKIKDNYIYTSKEEGKNYKKAYKIKSIGKYRLKLVSEKNNKEYNFQYGY